MPKAVSGRFACRLGARDDALAGGARCCVDCLTGLARRSIRAVFSGERAVLKGERGRVRELWDLGERIVEVEGAGPLRETVRVAFVFATVVVAVLARFLGLGRSCAWIWAGSSSMGAGAFSLSSLSLVLAVEMYSLIGTISCGTLMCRSVAPTSASSDSSSLSPATARQAIQPAPTMGPSQAQPVQPSPYPSQRAPPVDPPSCAV